jgi:hypothetical protein
LTLLSAPTSASLISYWIHAWGFYPLKLFSSDAAVRRLRRPCPLVVVTSVLSPRLSRSSDCSASCESGLRLFECPSPTGLCSTSKSATSCRWVRPTRAHGSSGLSCPSRFSPFSAQPGLHLISPLELGPSTDSDRDRQRFPPVLLRVFTTEKISLLRFRNRRPP